MNFAPPPRIARLRRPVGRPRRARLAGPQLAAVLSVVAACLLGLLLWQIDSAPSPAPAPSADSSAHSSSAPAAAPDRPLIVYCAAALKKPVEAIAKRYEAEFGVPVQLQFGPSQTLLANLEVARTGDLYLPADDSYLTVAAEKQLIAEQIPLCRMQAVLAVAQGNPKQIASLPDLLAKNVRIALANPDAAAITQLARRRLEPSGRWAELLAKTTVQKTTVTEVAADVGVGAVDAALVWDVVARDFQGVQAVSDPELDQVVARVALGVLNSSRQPTAALRFARYLAAPDRGLEELQRRHYQPLPGDPWAETPELVLYAGSMLRPAIEATISEFERREGVRVARVYNGCGILVAEMQAGRIPDAYFACDREFMNLVKQDFPDSADLATNQLVILVREGNPHRIRNLADLARPGLRIGVGHEKQCAMGWLTQRTFREAKVETQVMKNVVVQTPTGDMLVNQLRTGSLDAAVAYLSNAVNAGDELDAVAIENLPCALAVQPYGVARNSDRPRLTARLLDALRSPSSRQRFLDAGFQWNADRASP